MNEILYCRDCILAKYEPSRNMDLWFCGKHRRVITEHTIAPAIDKGVCKDYFKRKKR